MALRASQMQTQTYQSLMPVRAPAQSRTNLSEYTPSSPDGRRRILLSQFGSVGAASKLRYPAVASEKDGHSTSTTQLEVLQSTVRTL